MSHLHVKPVLLLPCLQVGSERVCLQKRAVSKVEEFWHSELGVGMFGIVGNICLCFTASPCLLAYDGGKQAAVKPPQNIYCKACMSGRRQTSL